jgi:YD repeat-containing protein
MAGETLSHGARMRLVPALLPISLLLTMGPQLPRAAAPPRAHVVSSATSTAAPAPDRIVPRAAVTRTGSFRYPGEAFGVRVDSTNPGADIERSACVTVAIRPDVAYECGDLRLTYSLPAIRYRNQTRAPTLLYNSQHARPTPIVRAMVTPNPLWPTPLYVRAILRVNGVERVRQDWAWASISGTLGAKQRTQVALSYDASSDPTGLYPYTFEVVIDYGVEIVSGTTSGELAIVNRSTSEFGRGWWLAGYERLVYVNATSLLWVGGDGSTRKYVYGGEQSNGAGGVWGVYRARSLAGVDSIMDPHDGHPRRYLSHGAWVQFDPNGRHEATVNAQGHITQLTSAYGCGRLGAIRLQDGPGVPFHGWSFNYDRDNTGQPCVGQALHTSSAAVGTINGVTTSGGFWRDTQASYGLFTSVGQVNGNTVLTGDTVIYNEANARVSSWRDNRGTTTTFVYGAGGLLSSARTPTGVGSDSVIQRFRSADSVALAAPALPSAVYTAIYSPRWPAVTAFTKLVLGPWGNPLAVTDAAGRTASVLPHATFSLLAARVTNPAGWSQYAMYNAHGKLTYMNADPVGGTGTPEWYYYYDNPAYPDNLTRARDAAGVWTQYTHNGPVFNTYPSLSDVENTANAATRVSVTYCQVARCLGLPSATLSAQNAQGARSKDSLDYYALGNVSLSLSGGGKRTETTNDGIGRVLSTRTLVATTPSLRWVTTDMGYDALDRVTATTTTAPGDGVTGQQQLETRTQYVGASGLVASVRRWSMPDQVVGVLRDSSTYDALGRVQRHFAQGTTTDPMKAEAFVYDAAGNLTQRVTARGDTIRMEYDALNRLTRRLTPAVTYDSVRLGTATNAPGDPERSPVFPQFALGAATYLGIEGEEATFSYDPLSGQLARAANREAIVERKYDPIGA